MIPFCRFGHRAQRVGCGKPALPLFESTKEIIRKENIDKMKDGAIIINTSRGPLINEDDLDEALNSGKIFAAAVDVLSVEPPRGYNKLIANPRCITTPGTLRGRRKNPARG